MKRFAGIVLLLLCMSLLGCAVAVAALPKRIFITLDVSSSMKGNKYVMANYAAQALTVFSNADDVVTVYYLGRRHELRGADGYRQLQIPYGRHRGTSSYFEISDITEFLKDYRPEAGYEDWLFIIGDGDWDYARSPYASAVEQFAELLAMDRVQVCYLQTGDNLSKDYAFTRFLTERGSGMVDVRKSDTTAVSVLSNCIYFANKILGFSHSSVSLHPQGPARVTFCSELPLERCLLVCQTDGGVGADVAITDVRCQGRRIGARVKGRPSTRGLVSAGSKAVDGIVWELTSAQTIPAGDTVEVCFNTPVAVKTLTLYPYVDVAVGARPWSVALDTLPEVSPEVFALCDQEREVLVKVGVTNRDSIKFPPPLMQRMEVLLSVDGKEVAATYDGTDTTFQVVLPMRADTLTYFSKVECPGYFSRVSSRQTVVKAAGVCPPPPEPPDNRPWLVRYRLHLLALLALLVLEAYFLGLLKKKRFHKGARMKNSYVTDDFSRETEKNGRPLRRAGLGAWLSRWLNPFGAERSTMSFTRPRTGSLTFIATSSKNKVQLSASSFNPKTMSVPNYVPLPSGRKRGKGAPVSLSTGTSIEIKKVQGTSTSTLGHLKFVSEGRDDEGGFRLFLGLLMLLGALALCFVAFVLVRGL